ncbi:hypothetical protein C922_01827 [Plasmodium inui San Antonio 1]|uniref:Uncharacterized protein n=1 Tax=Plasmodium inui San Antonio 1 TaxID=1237626 RepID=W7A340_9APIC|nr:hypothetical protein C922_01827 [Plasmodium inui San Antonio 1]EUD67642.1 hypothetical protein C922_01827 [Plasmodium inui San Antonio 1]
MGIRVSRNFMTYQNIYTFNKAKFNDANHRCTFEYDHVGCAKRGEPLEEADRAERAERVERVHRVQPAHHRDVAPRGGDPPNRKKGKVIIEGDFKSEQNQRRDMKTPLRKLTHLRNLPKKKKIKKHVTRTGEEAQRVNFSSPPKNDNSENNKVLEGDRGGDPLMCTAKGKELPPTEGNNQLDETHQRSREGKNHQLKKKVSSKNSSLYRKATASLLDYIKLLRSRTKERGEDRQGRTPSRKKRATVEEEKNNTIADMKNKTRISRCFSIRMASKAVTQTTSETASQAASQAASQTAATAPKSYDLHLVLSFSNQPNEKEIFTRLLHNELRYTDVLYLRNKLKQNEDAEKTIASCNCVIVSQKKLLLLHEQNKMIRNYGYRDLKLHQMLPQNNDHIKLVEHLSLANCLPDISFCFYMSHELMHTYLWVSHLDTSVHFEEIQKIVKKLHSKSFYVRSENTRGDKFHKRLGYHLSPELKEALCGLASVHFMHHVREVNAEGCENGHSYDLEGESIHERECELIDYYIRTCERGGSPMYGKNYQEIKRIMKNYTLVDILHIIGDIKRARLYPVVSLRLLRPVISSIRAVS